MTSGGMAHSAQPRQFLLDVPVGVAFELDEQPASIVDAVASGPVEDPAFLHAIDCAFPVADGVPAPGAELAVSAAGGSLDKVPALDEGDVEPPHGEVASGARAGGSAADNDDQLSRVHSRFESIIIIVQHCSRMGVDGELQGGLSTDRYRGPLGQAVPTEPARTRHQLGRSDPELASRVLRHDTEGSVDYCSESANKLVGGRRN